MRKFKAQDRVAAYISGFRHTGVLIEEHPLVYAWIFKSDYTAVNLTVHEKQIRKLKSIEKPKDFWIDEGPTDGMYMKAYSQKCFAPSYAVYAREVRKKSK